MTPFGLLDLYGHRLKLILVTMYLFPLCLIPLKKSLEIQIFQSDHYSQRLYK